jgi:hypothetical protein
LPPRLLLADAGAERNTATISPAGGGAGIGLVLARSFDHLRAVGPEDLAFYRPESPLLGGASYDLALFAGLEPLRFVASTETPRIDSTLSLRVSEQQVAPSRLSTAACDTGPLVDREFSRIARVQVSAEPAVRLLLSVVGHDTVTGEDAEDSAVRAMAEPGDVSLDFPLPEGVEPCLHVQVFDYAGDLLLDTREACAAETEGVVRESVRAFDPSVAVVEAAPVAVDEPAGPRTSRGCGLSRAGASGWQPSIIIALLALGARRRRRVD